MLSINDSKWLDELEEDDGCEEGYHYTYDCEECEDDCYLDAWFEEHDD